MKEKNKKEEAKAAEKEKDSLKEFVSSRIAKKDFVLHQNEHHFEIKEGDDLDKLGVPSIFDENLKTEQVI